MSEYIPLNSLEYKPVESDRERIEMLSHNLKSAETTIKKLKKQNFHMKKELESFINIENVIYLDGVSGKNKKLDIIKAVYIENKGIRILVKLPESIQRKNNNDL